MYHETTQTWKYLMNTGLKEDGSLWDWTTLGTVPEKEVSAKVIAKSSGIWAAQDLVQTLSSIAPQVNVEPLIKDGDCLQSGTCIVTLKGRARDILALERPFLNLAAFVSGIATETAKIVGIVHAACPRQTPRVTLTRKTLPGYRDVSIHGVRVGGGHPHRVSLSGGILIKENHIASAGGISQAVLGVKKVAPHGLKVEVEVRNLDELLEAVHAKAEGVLLDNFSPKMVDQALKYVQNLKLSSSFFIEVSGGINEGNISEYAQVGVDILSLGSLTHTVTPIDLSLLVI